MLDGFLGIKEWRERLTHEEQDKLMELIRRTKIYSRLELVSVMSSNQSEISHLEQAGYAPELRGKYLDGQEVLIEMLKTVDKALDGSPDHFHMRQRLVNYVVEFGQMNTMTLWFYLNAEARMLSAKELEEQAEKQIQDLFCFDGETPNVVIEFTR